ncbi:hypothetical protein ACWDBD_48945 [Streptomyces sp. NPDC001118]
MGFGDFVAFRIESLKNQVNAGITTPERAREIAEQSFAALSDADKKEALDSLNQGTHKP